MAKRAKAIEARRQEALEEKQGLLRELEGQEELKLHLLPARRRGLLRADQLSQTLLRRHPPHKPGIMLHQNHGGVLRQ